MAKEAFTAAEGKSGLFVIVIFHPHGRWLCTKMMNKPELFVQLVNFAASSLDFHIRQGHESVYGRRIQRKTFKSYYIKMAHHKMRSLWQRRMDNRARFSNSINFRRKSITFNKCQNISYGFGNLYKLWKYKAFQYSCFKAYRARAKRWQLAKIIPLLAPLLSLFTRIEVR